MRYIKESYMVIDI